MLPTIFGPFYFATVRESIAAELMASSDKSTGRAWTIGCWFLFSWCVRKYCSFPLK